MSCLDLVDKDHLPKDFVVITSLQIKSKSLITQRSRNISFTCRARAFNTGFFLTKIDKIKTLLTP